MQTALIYSIVTVLLVFAGLTIVIILGKAWRETVEAYHRGRRQEIEPVVLAYSHAETVSILPGLGGQVRPRDRNVVEKVLLEFIQQVRGIERDRLGRAFDELGYVNSNLEQLQSPRWWFRADAAEKLGLSGARRATEQLASALNDEVPEVRIRAANALGKVGGRASVVPLIAALNEPNRWSTIRIADILTGMGTEVVQELVNGWDDLNHTGRLAAIDIFGRIRHLDAVPWLRERLSDEHADIRARAAHALGAIAEPGSAELLQQAMHDQEWPVRAMAAKALGRIRDRDSIPVLCSALRDPEWWVRANAADGLRLMGPDGIEALIGMLDDDDNYARHQAVLMLGEAGEIDAWAEKLATGDETARDRIRRVVRSGQTGRLEELSRRHPDPTVRDRIAAVLSEETP